MARKPKEGGLAALCRKNGITNDQLFSFLGDDIKERALWDWAKTKPTALEAIIIGVSQQLGTIALTDADGCTHYTHRFEMVDFITQKIGVGWKISDESIWDANDNLAFTVKQLGNNPALVL